MIDAETAKQGLSALAVAAASIIEDVHEAAVTPPKTFARYRQTAQILRVAGSDLAMLAAAMEVLARRSNP
jgi:hypothetical protein